MGTFDPDLVVTFTPEKPGTFDPDLVVTYALDLVAIYGPDYATKPHFPLNYIINNERNMQRKETQS